MKLKRNKKLLASCHPPRPRRSEIEMLKAENERWIKQSDLENGILSHQLHKSQVF